MRAQPGTWREPAELQGEARRALEPLRTDDQRTVRYAAVWALSGLQSRGNDEPDPAEPKTDEGTWTPPKPTVSPRPQYPQAAFAAKVEGTVLVEILIGEEGEVAHLEIRAVDHGPRRCRLGDRAPVEVRAGASRRRTASDRGAGSGGLQDLLTISALWAACVSASGGSAVRPQMKAKRRRATTGAYPMGAPFLRQVASLPENRDRPGTRSTSGLLAGIDLSSGPTSRSSSARTAAASRPARSARRVLRVQSRGRQPRPTARGLRRALAASAGLRLSWLPKAPRASSCARRASTTSPRTSRRV